jgi:signal transduction histidine kinase
MKEQQQYKILYSIAQKLNSNLASEDVLNTIVEDLAKAANAKGTSLMLLTQDKKQLLHTVAYGLSGWYVKKGPVRVDESIKRTLEGKPVAIKNGTTDPRVQYKEQAEKEGIVSVLSLPLMVRGEVIGIIRIYTEDLRDFNSEEVEFYSALANLGAIALERATLHESMDRDLASCKIERSLLEQEKIQFLRFLGMAAHDLKAPLSAIQSYLRIMLDGYVGEVSEKQRHMLDRCRLRIDELFNLISDLLDIPRIETGQLIEEMEEISIALIIDSFSDEAMNAAKQKGLIYSTEIPSDLPTVKGSSSRLKQVVSNLVNNAIHYTDKGEIIVRARVKDNDVIVEVLDTGKGVPPQDLPRIFEDFFRASNVETRGTGLGLSISKRIIEAHGGKIWAESPCPETGKGSKFSFSLIRSSSQGGER